MEISGYDLKRELRQLKKGSDSKLEKAVLSILLKRYDKSFTFVDSLCSLIFQAKQTGIIQELATYEDIGRFYKKHRTEIIKLIRRISIKLKYDIAEDWKEKLSSIPASEQALQTKAVLFAVTQSTQEFLRQFGINI